MPQITAIEPQKRKAGRFNIFVDGKFSFALSEKILADEDLAVGQKITGAKIEKLITEYELSKNLEKVFKFLSYRLRSQKEIVNYLKKRNLGEEEINLIVKKLEKLKMLNDFEFAKFFIESRLKFRPKGKQLLKLELTQKGVEKDTIEKVLSEIEISEVELAQTAISKKLPRFLKLGEIEAKTKVFQFLARRGFTWEVIKTVVDTALKTR